MKEQQKRDKILNISSQNNIEQQLPNDEDYILLAIIPPVDHKMEVIDLG